MMLLNAVLLLAMVIFASPSAGLLECPADVGVVGIRDAAPVLRSVLGSGLSIGHVAVVGQC